MADISKIQLPDGSEYDITDKTSGYITGMTILSYGHSTWAEFLEAYNADKVVYCRASSNSNPATGNQTRLAFMAYVNSTPPTNVEFQYYRSVATHSATQQGDQVYVYKLDKNAGWSVIVREAMSKIAVGSGLKSSYASSTITLDNNTNGFANVKVGSTTVAADTTTDTLELIAGTNITLTPDATNDTVTISASGGSSEAYFPIELIRDPNTGDVSGADKTFTEINTAYNNGKIPIVIDEDFVAQLYMFTGTYFQFWGLTDDNVGFYTVYISSQNAVVEDYYDFFQLYMFNHFKVGNTNLVPDNAADTLEFVAGTNVTLTPDAANDTITISATGGSVTTIRRWTSL